MNARRIAILLAGFSLLLPACTGGSSSTGPPASSAAPSATTTTPPTPPNGNGVPVSLFGFGTLPAVPLLGDTPAYAGPSTPQRLTGVRIPKALLRLTQAARQRLTRNGFVVIPSDNKFMYQAYTDAPYMNWPVFVTTDVAYHQWHLTFDKLLRSIEQDVLLPKLEALAREGLANAQKQATELRGSLAGAADRVRQLFQVEATLLGLPAG